MPNTWRKSVVHPDGEGGARRWGERERGEVGTSGDTTFVEGRGNETAGASGGEGTRAKGTRECSSRR